MSRRNHERVTATALPSAGAQRPKRSADCLCRWVHPRVRITISPSPLSPLFIFLLGRSSSDMAAAECVPVALAAAERVTLEALVGGRWSLLAGSRVVGAQERASERVREHVCRRSRSVVVSL